MAIEQDHSKTNVNTAVYINSKTEVKTMTEVNITTDLETMTVVNTTIEASNESGEYDTTDSSSGISSKASVTIRSTLPSPEPIAEDDSGDLADVDTDTSSEAGTVLAPIEPVHQDPPPSPPPQQGNGAMKTSIPHIHTWKRTPLTPSVLRELERESEDENSGDGNDDGEKVPAVICCTTCQQPIEDGIWRCQLKARFGLFCDACYFSSSSSRRPVRSGIEEDEE